MRSRGGAAEGALVQSAFERRAARAEALATESSAAAEALRFAAGLYRAQGELAALIASLHAERPLSGRLEDDGPRFVDHSGGLLAFAAEQGPPALVAAVAERADDDAAAACARLLGWWNAADGLAGDYLSRALLRPYAAVLAATNVRPLRAQRSGHCGFCGGPPWIASRKIEVGGEGADGAARRLGCALCGGDWIFARGRCPGCGEEDPGKLPVFSAEAHPNVRLEACESCRRYLKSIDLTLDARPIPEVDDLLSLSLDLWAAEAGFTRLEPGLAGL